MIQVDNVSMRFKLAHDRIQSLKEYMTKLIKRQLRYEEFWALKNVSFNVTKGDVVGII